MTDTPESVRAVSESMRRLVTARAVDVAEDWRVNGPRTPVLDAHNMLARYAVLLEQVAAHERKCAGKWVKVTERLPDAHNEVAIIDSHGVASGFVDSRGGWRYVKTPVYATPTHWLDARMPGEER